MTRGQTIEGQPAVEWAAQQPGGQMLRGSCGLCPSCARGCDYDTKVYEVEQYEAGHYGKVVERLVKPGEKTTAATAPAPQYACNCDACRAAYVGDPRSM